MPKYKVGQRFTHVNAPGYIAEITSVTTYTYRLHWKYINKTSAFRGEESDNSHAIESVDEENSEYWTLCGSSLEDYVLNKLKENGYG